MATLFISYSSNDRDIVKRIAIDLRSNGFDVWLDEWEIKVGQSIVKSVGRGIDEADFVVLVLSSNSVKSGWVEVEWSSAYWDQIRDGEIRLLPILLDKCKLPTLLKSIKYADFRGDYKNGMRELISSLQQYTNVVNKVDVIRFASDRYLWRDSKDAIAFKNVMERWGFEHFSDYDDEILIRDSENLPVKTKHIHKNINTNSSINKLRNSYEKALKLSSEENSKKILAKSRKKIDEMTKELGISYSDAYSTIMTSETIEMITECVEEPFKTFIFSLDGAIDVNEEKWMDNTEAALDYGTKIIKLILDVGRRYNNETVEADTDEILEWMINILYITGGTPRQMTGFPTLGLNPFPSYDLRISALQANLDGDKKLGLAITLAWFFSLFVENDYERRLSIIEEYLDRLEWCEEEGDGEILLAFLKFALIENELDIPRKTMIKLLDAKAKHFSEANYFFLDEEGEQDKEIVETLVTTLENLADQLRKL